MATDHHNERVNPTERELHAVQLSNNDLELFPEGYTPERAYEEGLYLRSSVSIPLGDME